MLELLSSVGQLTDAWHVRNPTLHSNPSPQEAIRLNGMTCDSPLCSYSAGKHLATHAVRHHGKRLDYIYFRPARQTQITCIDTKVSLTSLVPGQSFSFSDHFGVEAAFSISSAPIEASQQQTGSYKKPGVIASSKLEQIIDGLTIHRTHARSLARYNLQLLGVSAALGIFGLPIACSFQPLAYLNWLFVLLATGCGALGATMLYVGFVGGNWEANALSNAIEELEEELRRPDR